MCFLDKHSTTEPHTYPSPSPSSVDAEAWKEEKTKVDTSEELAAFSAIRVKRSPSKDTSRDWLFDFVKDGKKYHGETV